MRRFLFMSVCLVILIAGVYSQTRGFAFVAFDDPQLVTENVHVRQGLTRESLEWAMFSAWRENVFFYPLSLLSHMLDVTWAGLDPGRHHLTSVGLHAAVTLSLFALLIRLTGAFWRPALTAALFAVHPLAVDSVAWVAERSNLLCALLTVGSIWAFVRYGNNRRRLWYGFSLGLFFLALLAKPTAVMVPVALLLIRPPEQETFPGTCRRSGLFLHIVTLSPFFALSILRLLAVMAVVRDTGPMAAGGEMTTGILVANALVSLSEYLADVFCPCRLSVYYPFPEYITLWQLVVSGLLLLAITVTAFHNRHRRPLVWGGWLWFLVFLIPSLGMVRSGPWPARADHYVYIPLMGLLTALVWMVPEQSIASWKKKFVAGATAVFLVICFSTATFVHTRHYRDSVALFERALSLNPHNFLACLGLGNAYREQGRMDLAEIYFRKAIRIKPDSPGAHNNLGLVLSARQDWGEAEKHFKTALALSPGFAMARNNLMNLYLRQQDPSHATVDREWTIEAGRQK